MSTRPNIIGRRDPALEAIVATYAPIGSRMRQQEQRRRGLLAGGCALVASAGILLAASQLPDLGMTLVTDAPSNVAVQTRSANWGDAGELIAERESFLKRLDDLEAQIAAVNAQRDNLDAERAKLQEQGDRLEEMLAAVSNDQQGLEVRQDQGSLLDREIRAMAAQREELTRRWSQFEAQGELLAMEIVAVNTQRRELDTQRQKIDAQQSALAELLDRAEGLYRRAARSPVPEISPENTPEVTPEIDEETTATEVDDDSLNYTYNSLVADVNDMIVENGQLEQMRGGFSVGQGLDVSFGFTQTGEINGVEQYRNNFTIDSMAAGYKSADMSNMNSVVLQQGSGNFVGPDVLNSMSSNFGSIIQNSLDDQTIGTTTTYDLSLHNVPGTVQGLAGERALMDSLGAF